MREGVVDTHTHTASRGRAERVKVGALRERGGNERAGKEGACTHRFTRTCSHTHIQGMIIQVYVLRVHVCVCMCACMRVRMRVCIYVHLLGTPGSDWRREGCSPELFLEAGMYKEPGATGKDRDRVTK